MNFITLKQRTVQKPQCVLLVSRAFNRSSIHSTSNLHLTKATSKTKDNGNKETSRNQNHGNKFKSQETNREKRSLYVNHIGSGNGQSAGVRVEELRSIPSLSIFQQNQRSLVRQFEMHDDENIKPHTSTLERLDGIPNDFFTVDRTTKQHDLFNTKQREDCEQRAELPDLHIKGLVEVSAFKFIKKNFNNNSFLLYKCKYFHMYYFPPQHYLKLFLKSEVCLQVLFRSGNFINGNKEGTKYNISLEESKNQNECAPSGEASHSKTSNTIMDPNLIHFLKVSKGGNIPSQMAFQRTTAKKFFKTAFKKQWTNTNKGSHCDSQGNTVPGYSKKGLYLYSVLTVPDKLRIDDEEYERNIAESVMKANRLDWYKDLFPKVQKANSTVPAGYLNEKLFKSSIPYRVFHKYDSPSTSNSTTDSTDTKSS